MLFWFSCFMLFYCAFTSKQSQFTSELSAKRAQLGSSAVLSLIRVEWHLDVVSTTTTMMTMTKKKKKKKKA